MSKFLEKFKSLSVFMKIVAIALVVAFLLGIFAMLAEFIFEMIDNGFIRTFFPSFPGFLENCMFIVKDLVLLVFIAALVAAVISGKKKNIGFVLAAKATLSTVSLLFIDPFIDRIFITTYSYRAVFSLGMFQAWFVQLLEIVALFGIAILMFDGFGRISKLMGIIFAGLCGVLVLYEAVLGIIDIVNLVQSMIRGDLYGILYYILCALVFCLFYILEFASVGAISLGYALSIKGPVVQKKEG